jgi:hypothetical protein
MSAVLLTAPGFRLNLERQAFNILVDQQPAGIAQPNTADDVSDIVRTAAAEGKRVAAQRTGHNAAPLGSLADTVLDAHGRPRRRQIDRRCGPARVGAARSGVTSCQGHPSWPRRLHGSSPALVLLVTRSAVASASTIENTASPVTV